MRRILFVLAGLLALAPAASFAAVEPEIRPFWSSYVASNFHEKVQPLGVQLALELNDHFHVVGTFAYADRNDEGDLPNVQVYHYDAGAEVYQMVPMQVNLSLRPFLGAGLGGRTYHFDFGPDSDPVFGGYVGAGTEVQIYQVAVRFEARDYIARFKHAGTRDDVLLMAGLSIHGW